MASDFCVVMTTFDDDEVGQRIINTLISEHLAACVQVQAIQSHYHWQGKVHCDQEKLALIKTRRGLFPRVEAAILANHSYETPEIILVPIETGSAGYLRWIDEVCGIV